MKKCPFCAEDIKDEAVVCKHCHKDLAVPSDSNLTKKQKKELKKAEKKRVAEEEERKEKELVAKFSEKDKENYFAVKALRKKYRQWAIVVFLICGFIILSANVALLTLFLIIIGIWLFKHKESPIVPNMKGMDRAVKEYLSIIAVLFICLPISVIFGFKMEYDSGPTTSRTVPKEDVVDGITVYSCAKDLVSQQLKSPSSADFPFSPSKMVQGLGDSWTVEGYVDSQNSFGATLRSSFSCTLNIPDSDSCSGYCSMN